MSRRGRKQRITLRFKRREQLKHHLRTVIGRSVALALVVGFGAGLVTSGDTFLSRFIHRHTPSISVSSSQILAGLPVLAELPKNRFWLWFPGSEIWLEKRLCRQYTSVRAVRFEREFQTSRIVVNLDPRVPLVSCNGSGLDREGVLFAITPGAWKALPQASFLASARKPEMGRWLARLAAIPGVWQQVTAIRETASGALELTLKTGTVVVWGPPEADSLTRKAQTLLRILDDAHKNMGGAARADLRFFDQGRIIVRPKGVRGD